VTVAAAKGLDELFDACCFFALQGESRQKRREVFYRSIDRVPDARLLPGIRVIALMLLKPSPLSPFAARQSF
jgi:hypothetical protein